MRDVTIKFNGINYVAKYNAQSGYYEIDLETPQVGGIYKADINYTDLFGQNYEDSKIVQVLAKQKLKIKTNKVFMWIFDHKDFSVKDIIEISDYEINIDEETNANSIIKVLKNTTAKSSDIVAIKKNNEIIFWGTIDNIQNEDGSQLYQYSIKYITNIFNQKVALNRNVNNEEIEEGTYRIKSILDTKKVIDVSNGSLENGANVWLYENNNTDAQKWRISKGSDGFYKIKCIKSGKVLDVSGGNFTESNNVQQWQDGNVEAQKWKFEKSKDSVFLIGNKNFYLTVEYGSTNNGTNIKINSKQAGEGIKKQQFVLEKIEETVIKEQGIEDFLAKTIKENFINSKDTFINKNYLEVRVKTHTKLQTKVTNVQDNIYNLHTWMTNCTQLYNINYNFFIEDKKLIIEIKNKSLNKELIDTTAQAISNYSEVFETDIVSKVEVLTDTESYYLYLLNDRTTTTDSSNENRADGKTETVYTDKIEEANQKALDVITANKYNHMITFNMFEKFMKVGTPIAIKTKKSVVFDTYISAIKITPNNFNEYTCGNIRVKFIDKLLKERNK